MLSLANHLIFFAIFFNLACARSQLEKKSQLHPQPALYQVRNSSTPLTLNLTALSASNGHSTLECWQLTSPFAASIQSGTVGASAIQLGNIANASLSILPARYDAGAHRAPAMQYVIFLSGLAHITLPYSRDKAWVRGGKLGIIIAADTADVSVMGHNTTYPSEEETVTLQIPVMRDNMLKHVLLHSGPCQAHEERY